MRDVLGERHRWHAVRGHLHELSGDLAAAATAYADGARRATDVAERDHLVRQASRARDAEHAMMSLDGFTAGLDDDMGSGTPDNRP